MTHPTKMVTLEQDLILPNIRVFGLDGAAKINDYVGLLAGIDGMDQSLLETFGFKEIKRLLHTTPTI
jgi:hypothetical protein